MTGPGWLGEVTRPGQWADLPGGWGVGAPADSCSILALHPLVPAPALEE